MKQFFEGRLKSGAMTSLILFAIETASAQNVGIGIDPPTRGRLETRGMVGNTLALFGQEVNGISLVANIPGIYFNSYFNGGIRSIQAGRGGNLSFDPTIGRFRFFTTNMAAGPDQFLTQNLLFTIEASGNVIAPTFSYANPRTFYYSIPAADFTGRDGADVVRKEFGAGGASMNNGNGFNGMIAPVHLPHGATVTAITFHYTDNSATTDLEMVLMKYNAGGSSYTMMASLLSAGTPGEISRSIGIMAEPVIDNATSSYMIRVTSNPLSWPNTLLIRTVIITYTMFENN